ncbi:hypothetical protein SMICM17S_09261 [Streptomyces microflavus]
MKPPKYGMARAAHEWRTAVRWILAAVVALGLLQAAIWYVGPGDGTASLQGWQQKMGLVIGINLIIAAGYTLFPKQAPRTPPRNGSPPTGSRYLALTARHPQHVPDLLVRAPRQDEQEVGERLR